MTKKCENCGAEFQCGADQATCWCRSLPVIKNLPTTFKDCLCSTCLANFAKPPVKLIAGEDFYWEGEAMVFTKAYHIKRGFCCKSSATGCRHCPYR